MERLDLGTQAAMAEAIVMGNVRAGLTVRAAITEAISVLGEGIETHPDLPRELRLRTENIFSEKIYGKVPN